MARKAIIVSEVEIKNLRCVHCGSLQGSSVVANTPCPANKCDYVIEVPSFP